MIAFRQCDRRFPFLWEITGQHPARWHGPGEGPVQYLASTPDGAWAEFLRHEEIVDEVDLQGVSRAIWAIDVDEPRFAEPSLPEETLIGGLDFYAACRDEARRLRGIGATALRAPSAALEPRAAGGWRVELGFRAGQPTDGTGICVVWPASRGRGVARG